MAGLLFYEKPGCVGNGQQKAQLRDQGIELVVHDLLTTPWTAEALRPFFGDKPVKDWFNLSAPAVKAGAIDIHGCDEPQALQMMLAYPLLIRRPLLQLGAICQSGYVDGPVLKALGVVLDPGEDLQSCPMDDKAAECGAPT